MAAQVYQFSAAVRAEKRKGAFTREQQCDIGREFSRKLQRHFTGSEWTVLPHILDQPLHSGRHSWGFTYRKMEHGDDHVRGTGYSRSTLIRTVSALERRGVITRQVTKSGIIITPNLTWKPAEHTPLAAERRKKSPSAISGEGFTHEQLHAIEAAIGGLNFAKVTVTSRGVRIVPKLAPGSLGGGSDDTPGGGSDDTPQVAALLPIREGREKEAFIKKEAQDSPRPAGRVVADSGFEETEEQALTKMRQRPASLPRKQEPSPQVPAAPLPEVPSPNAWPAWMPARLPTAGRR